MKLSVKQLRSLIREAKAENSYGEVIDGGPVWDAWLRFAPKWQEGEATPAGFSRWLELHGCEHRSTDWILDLMKQAPEGSLFEAGGPYVDDMLSACEVASRGMWSRTKPTAMLVMGRDATTGELKFEERRVVLGFDLVVEADEATGQPIWTFDPETLELGHIPTYSETWNKQTAKVDGAAKVNLFCAMLNVIESGDV